ncbi:hypothetical protein STM14_4336 [Salmonella enterica subsp. enterica serovar Typhimurium str. 14028S]|uniref:Uncharacterized protein n=2 Tax=Salmonella enterica I TaxID=59201 RepID=A0A0F6B876_SALT1|nr:hypothetical protein SPAB_04475 [Salmonella enterica subsp. enterica serovar Paratyphi B str. SPB7]ACY90724.1 hypothetical protein STM14_4336 [Salmonella enterica subsp. enterica serovar Typhimurium str. 14028S]
MRHGIFLIKSAIIKCAARVASGQTAKRRQGKGLCRSASRRVDRMKN